MRILMVIAISCMVSAAWAQPLLTAQIRSYIYEINTYMDFEDVEGFIFDRADSIARSLLRYRDRDAYPEFVFESGPFFKCYCQKRPDLTAIEIMALVFSDFYRHPEQRPGYQRQLLNRGFPEVKFGVLTKYSMEPHTYSSYISRVKKAVNRESQHILNDVENAADEEILSYLNQKAGAYELGSKLWAVDLFKELSPDERRIFINYLFENWCNGLTAYQKHYQSTLSDVQNFRSNVKPIQKEQ